MNKVLIPKVTFKDIVFDGKRVEMAYARILGIARRNILAKRALTNSMTAKYTEVQHDEEVLNNRGGLQNVES